MGKRRFEEMSLTDWEKPDNLKKIEEWAGQGKRLGDVADKMGISRSTLFEWRKKSLVISDALKKGDDRAVDKAEETLFELATEGKNIAALIFYLKNKRPNKWRDKRDTEITGDGKLAFEWDGTKKQGEDKAK